jgi:hypothetical protein
MKKRFVVCVAKVVMGVLITSLPLSRNSQGTAGSIGPATAYVENLIVERVATGKTIQELLGDHDRLTDQEVLITTSNLLMRMGRDGPEKRKKALIQIIRHLQGATQPEGFDALLSCLADPRVRAMAAGGLLVSPTESYPRLAPVIAAELAKGATDDWYCVRLVDILGRIGPPLASPCIPNIQTLLLDESRKPNLFAKCAFTLGRLGELDWLLDQFYSAIPTAKAAILEGLVVLCGKSGLHLGDTDAQWSRYSEVVLSALGDENQPVRKQAFQSILCLMGPDPFVVSQEQIARNKSIVLRVKSLLETETDPLLREFFTEFVAQFDDQFRYIRK